MSPLMSPPINTLSPPPCVNGLGKTLRIGFVLGLNAGRKWPSQQRHGVKPVPTRSFSLAKPVCNFVIYRYEREKKFRKQVKAQKLWFAILEAQTETGTPYMLYKDSCNKKSNQKVCTNQYKTLYLVTRKS